MTTPQLERLSAHCQRLRLHRVEAELTTLLEQAAKKDVSYADFRSENPQRSARKAGHEPGLSRAGLDAECTEIREGIPRILGQPSRADLASSGQACAPCCA